MLRFKLFLKLPPCSLPFFYICNIINEFNFSPTSSSYLVKVLVCFTDEYYLISYSLVINIHYIDSFTNKQHHRTFSDENSCSNFTLVRNLASLSPLPPDLH